MSLVKTMQSTLQTALATVTEIVTTVRSARDTIPIGATARSQPPRKTAQVWYPSLATCKPANFYATKNLPKQHVAQDSINNATI